jgi:hypothetical protein
METQELLSEIQKLPLAEQGRLLATLRHNLGSTARTAEEIKAQRRYCIEEGERIYRERLRAVLEPEQVGKFVAIDPQSGQYFLGVSSHEALQAARAALPERVFYLARVGYKAAHRIGGGRRALRG